jgi:hypothetical protein
MERLSLAYGEILICVVTSRANHLRKRTITIAGTFVFQALDVRGFGRIRLRQCGCGFWGEVAKRLRRSKVGDRSEV